MKLKVFNRCGKAIMRYGKKKLVKVGWKLLKAVLEEAINAGDSKVSDIADAYASYD